MAHEHIREKAPHRLMWDRYFTTLDLKYSFPRVILDFILSASLYHGTVWIFSLESRYDWIVQLDGLIGSLVYLILTFVLLNVRMKIAEIVGVSILSGLAFLPFELLDHSITTCGIGVLLWTLLNGGYLNYCKIRMQTSNSILVNIS